MRVSLFEKVCLSLIGAIGGLALGAMVSMTLGRYGSAPWLIPIFAILGIAFGNWAWISVER